MEDFYKTTTNGIRPNLSKVIERFKETEYYYPQSQLYVTEKYVYSWYAVYMDVYRVDDWDNYVGRLAVEGCKMHQCAEKVKDVDINMDGTQTIQFVYEDFSNEYIELQVVFLG